MAPDRLDVFCDMAEYIQDSYSAFEKRAGQREAELLAKHSE